MPDVADDVDEHPIIFNEWSINRILAGEKTQTRRLTGLGLANRAPDRWGGDIEPPGVASFHDPDDGTRFQVESPYGTPGDVLWVREAFRFDRAFDDASPVSLVRHCPSDLRLSKSDVQYEATPEDGPFTEETQGRLRLRVEDVGVERVQEITREDALAEGVQPEEYKGNTVRFEDDPRLTFADKWRDRHGDGAWTRNDWVWVIKFYPIDHNFPH